MHFTCIIHIHVYNKVCSVFLKKKYSNRKLLKKRYEEKIDAVAAMMDAFVAFKINREAFE